MTLDLAIPDTAMLDADARFDALPEVETVDNEKEQEIAKAQAHAKHVCTHLKRACVVDGEFNDVLYSHLCGAVWQANKGDNAHFYAGIEGVEEAWSACAYAVEVDLRLEVVRDD